MVTYNIDNIEVHRVNREMVRIVFTNRYYKQSIAIVNNEIEYTGANLIEFGFKDYHPSIGEIFEVVYLYGNKNK